MKVEMIYVDGGSRHVLAIPKGSSFLDSLDYFTSVFERACKFKKTMKGVEVQYQCPLYSVCERQHICLVAEELRQITRRMER